MGSGTTFKEVSGSTMKNIVVRVPVSIEEQRRIARILGAIDDKIEENEKINNNLQQQAVTIFEKWLQTKHVTSEDSLANLTTEIIRGQTTKYVEKSELININQKVNKGQHLDMQYCKYLDPTIPISLEKFTQKGDILLNSLGQGTLGRTHFWYNDEKNFIVDQHITIIRARENITTPEYLYMVLSSAEFYNKFLGSVTGSTGMQMLNISVVRSMTIPVYSYEDQLELSSVLTPIFDMIESHCFENQKLAILRDSLLPKLMSGELCVENIVV